MLRVDLAKPDASRTVGPATISTGMSKSRTICRISVSCWWSFSPKIAYVGCVRLEQLHDDRQNTRKMRGPGDSLVLAAKFTWIDGDFGIAVRVHHVGVGANTRSTEFAAHRARSSSNVRGYLARSSFAPNCKGFTKMVAVGCPCGPTNARPKFHQRAMAGCSPPIVMTTALGWLARPRLPVAAIET